MSEGSGSTTNIFPGMRYEDAPGAIDFLEEAFGFERGLVVAGENEGEIAHAQLHLGPGIVMLGSARDDGLGFGTPREVGGVTGSIYVYVEDIDAHYRRAKAAGATITRELGDTEYGSREYMCTDPEGYVWSFGTYLPERGTEG